MAEEKRRTTQIRIVVQNTENKSISKEEKNPQKEKTLLDAGAAGFSERPILSLFASGIGVLTVFIPPALASAAGLPLNNVIGFLTAVVGVPIAITTGSMGSAIATPEGRKILKDIIKRKTKAIRNLFKGKSKEEALDQEPVQAAEAIEKGTTERASVASTPEKSIAARNAEGFCVSVVSKEAHGEKAPHLLSLIEQAKNLTNGTKEKVLRFGFEENPHFQDGSAIIPFQNNGALAISPVSSVGDMSIVAQKDERSICFINASADLESFQAKLENGGAFEIDTEKMPKGDRIVSAAFLNGENFLLGTQNGRAIYVVKKTTEPISPANTFVQVTQIGNGPITFKKATAEGLNGSVIAQCNSKEIPLLIENNLLKIKRHFPSASPTQAANPEIAKRFDEILETQMPAKTPQQPLTNKQRRPDGRITE